MFKIVESIHIQKVFVIDRNTWKHKSILQDLVINIIPTIWEIEIENCTYKYSKRFEWICKWDQNSLNIHLLDKTLMKGKVQCKESRMEKVNNYVSNKVKTFICYLITEEGFLLFFTQQIT